MNFCLNWTYKKINRKLCVESRVKPVPMKKPHSNSYELILFVFVLFFFLIADGQHKFGTQYKLFHSLSLSHYLLPFLLLFLWDVFSIKYVVLPSPPQKLPLPLKLGEEKREELMAKRMETNRKKDEWKEFVATTSVFEVYCRRFLWRFSLLVIIFFLSLFRRVFFSILFLNKL